MGKFVGGIVVMAILLGLLYYGIYRFERWLHWKTAYASQTTSLVCSMVKPSALKDPNTCR